MSDGEGQWLETVDPEVLRRRRERVALIAGAVVVFAIAIAIAIALNRSDSGALSSVYMAAQEAISSQLAREGKLRFSSMDETQIVQAEGDPGSDRQRYMVRGWVQDVAHGGEVKSYLFTAWVDRDPAARTDTVHSISLMPQN
jgi:hypothetical protein